MDCSHECCPVQLPRPSEQQQFHQGISQSETAVGFRSAGNTPEESGNRLQQMYETSHATNQMANSSSQAAHELIKLASVNADSGAELSRERLKARRHDTLFWMLELKREINELNEVIAKLLKQRLRLKDGLANLEKAHQICASCINARKRIYAEDKQFDTVHVHLGKEENVLNSCMELFNTAINHLSLQIASNIEIRKHLESIWSDKMQSADLVSIAEQTNVSSTNRQFYDGEARWNAFAGQTTEQSWAQHCHDAIKRAEDARVVSSQMLDTNKNIMIDSTHAVWQQKNTVDHELGLLVEKREAELAKLNQENEATSNHIGMQQRLLELLRNERDEKNNNLETVQTRLHCMNQRPCLENADDQARHALLREHANLEAGIKKLRESISHAERLLGSLEDNQLTFARQIEMKKNSLQVDRTQCTNQRMFWPEELSLIGH